MNIEYLRTFTSPDKSSLMVSFTEPTSNVLRTYIGTFVAGGERVEMNEEWLYEVPVNPSVHMSVCGSLVKHKQTGAWSIFVDEWYDDGEDELYRFDRSSPYKLFSHVFLFQLPAGTQNLEGTTVKVFTIEPLPKDDPDAPSPQVEG